MQEEKTTNKKSFWPVSATIGIIISITIAVLSFMTAFIYLGSGDSPEVLLFLFLIGFLFLFISAIITVIGSFLSVSKVNKQEKNIK